MTASQIFLVTVSSLGVIHGLFLALFLWATPKGNLLANRLLGFLLLILSFRVGKSVFLEFLENLDAKFVFTGLGTLMAIGPLFYFFTLASTDRSFKWNKKYFLHFIPCFLAILFGLWITEEGTETLPMLLFLVLFLSYYGHYVIYLVKARKHISRQRKAGLSDKTYKLLVLLFYGLLIIWVAYVLNLFDEMVPYVVGPVLYSIVAYVISFIVISQGLLWDPQQDKYKTTRISDEQMEQLFAKVMTMVVRQEQYKDPELTLKFLSEELKVSTQVLSMVINQKSEKNFNGFVNSYRIEEAVRLLNDPTKKTHTISAIAYESGFNSISSFNSAFKKFTGKTPQSYRQNMPE